MLRGISGFLPEYPASVPPSSPALHENGDPAGDNCCSLQSPTTTACLPVNTASHIHPSQPGKLHHGTASACQPRAWPDTGAGAGMAVCLHTDTDRQTDRQACSPGCTEGVGTPCLCTQTHRHGRALGAATEHAQMCVTTSQPGAGGDWR